MSHTREMRQYRRELERRGFAVSLTSKGHLRIETENGAIFAPGTPSDWRSIMKVESKLKRKLRERD